jgi:hypothetical protein
MAYTTFKNEKALLQSDGCTLVECDAAHRAGRQYVAVTQDGINTDYPHWNGVDRVVWDNSERFPVTFREKAARLIHAARNEYEAFNNAAQAPQAAAPKTSARESTVRCQGCQEPLFQRPGTTEYRAVKDGSEICSGATFGVAHRPQTYGGKQWGVTSAKKKADRSGSDGNADVYIEWGGAYDHRELSLDCYEGVCQWTDWGASNELDLQHAVGDSATVEEAKQKLQDVVFSIGEPASYIRYADGTVVKKKDHMNSGDRKMMGDMGIQARKKKAYNPGIPEYVYQADKYCEDCAIQRQEGLNANGVQDDGDSGTYPQGPYYNQESDAPEHCADCHKFLENRLTQEGYNYVRERAAENPNGPAIQQWLAYYGGDTDLTGVPMTARAKTARLNLDQLDEFTRAYMEAALWSSTDSAGTPLDDHFSVEDIPDHDAQQMIADCQKFQAENADFIQDQYLMRRSDYGVDGAAGHDFWLTRNGHGAGFWDGDWEEPAATKLDEASKKFNEYDLMMGHDTPSDEDEGYLEEMGVKGDTAPEFDGDYNHYDDTTKPASDKDFLKSMGIEAKKKASANHKRAARFNFGDRVRCTFTDPYSGVSEGDEGVVDVVAGFKGKSVHPDPYKKLLFVKWDNHGQKSVPTGKVEVISKGKGPNKVKPVKLYQGDKLVGEFDNADQAYAAAPQPWRKAYDQGYRLKTMTHVEEESARYKHEASEKKPRRVSRSNSK